MQHNYQYTYQDVSISPLKKEHIEDMRILRNNNRHAFVYSDIISKDAQEKWYENYISKPDDYMFSVYLHDLWIGVCSIYNVTESSAEFGRLIVDKTKTKKKGLGLTTTLCACTLAFEKLGIDKVYLQVYENNPAAYKTYLKAGFVPNGSVEDSKGQTLINMELTK